jgi:hypothetical protein
MTTFVCLIVVGVGVLLPAALVPGLWLQRFINRGFPDERTDSPPTSLTARIRTRPAMNASA